MSTGRDGTAATPPTFPSLRGAAAGNPATPPCSRPHTRGRLAPSPTGLLHMGNAWAFLLAWLAARTAGGGVVLRMEDIDPDRSRTEYAAGIMEDLRWLGLDWDEGPDMGGPCAPYAQQQRLPLYETALMRLNAAGVVYPCFCTRKELRGLAGAPHVGDIGAPYPGSCRDLTPEQRTMRARTRRPSWRLRCPDGPVTFHDAVYGPQCMTPEECGGDFALRRSDGVFAYQLAVVVDDAAMGITQVVRGRDILSSTPRQILLYRLLGAPVPAYIHVPLLLDENGERLAKRHHSLTLRRLRETGTSPEAVIGLLARLAGWLPDTRPLPPNALIPLYDPTTLSRESIRLTPGMLPR